MTGDTITLFDSIYPAQLPTAAQAYAGYTGGNWPTFGTLQALFPDAHLLSIAVFASEDADCLDVETGDATIAQVYGWFTRQRARGVHRPCIYTSAGNVDALVATMTANGFARSTYRLWSAHYGAGEHICGPRSCGLTTTGCDGTQWTDRAFGRTLDQSLLAADFFAVQPAPKPPPAPQPAPSPAPEDLVNLDTSIASHPLLIDFGVKTMDLLSVNTEAAPLKVTLTFLGEGAQAKGYTLSWGTADTVGSGIEVPAGNKKARIDVVSGGGLPLGVRYNT